MTIHLFRNFILICTLFSLTATSNAKENFNASINSAALKNYSWKSMPKTINRNLLINSIEVQRLVNRKVNQALSNKGFKKTSGKNADFLVNYKYNLKKPGIYTGIRTGIGSDHHTRREDPPLLIGKNKFDRDEYILTIEIINPHSYEIMWQGTSTDYLYRQANRKQNRDHISALVTNILSDLPTL